jgi:phosphohistidine phosphatase
MILYLFRHGIAMNVGTHGVKRDQDRMLSEEGRRRTAAAARGLENLHCRLGRIVCSPLIRARETAEIVAGILIPQQTTELNHDLGPDGSMKALVDWLEAQHPDPVMLVGHLPDLATLASLLLTGSDQMHLMLKKASCCCISFPGAVLPGTGGLEWLLQPKMLRMLGNKH